jgi:hypothetical protein
MKTKKVIDKAEHNTPRNQSRHPRPEEISGPISDGPHRNELVTAVGKPEGGSTLAEGHARPRPDYRRRCRQSLPLPAPEHLNDPTDDDCEQ